MKRTGVHVVDIVQSDGNELSLTIEIIDEDELEIYLRNRSEVTLMNYDNDRAYTLVRDGEIFKFNIPEQELRVMSMKEYLKLDAVRDRVNEVLINQH